jgi:DNA mismatch endonuclease (patch repair protein)
MQSVRSKDTTPELVIRRLAFALGYRFRLHRRDLPGSPDIVFVKQRKAILVNGCFWHGHDCQRGSRQPKTNLAYWGPKIERNRERDHSTLASLAAAGWSVLVVWECELKDRDRLASSLTTFLEN